MQEILIESLVDCLKLLPFLFLSYLVVEYAEHKMSERTKQIIYRAGKAGPLLGALIGVIPQCGFSAAAAGLFAGGMISPGTLLAVFLSTSDEMLPIMVSEGIRADVILRILLVKVIAAMAAGLLLDVLAEYVFGRTYRMNRYPAKSHSDDACGDGHRHGDRHRYEDGHRHGDRHRYEDGHRHGDRHSHGEGNRCVNCGCRERGIGLEALEHTLQTAVFLFLVSLLIGLGMEFFDVEGFSHTLARIAGVEEMMAGLVGMIPNCAASVLITQLFLEGILGSGALFSGLLCGAGTGLLVLYRENKSHKMNLALTAALYVSGVAAGIIIGRLGIL